MTKVIVAITTYNLEKYIAKALDSILCQKTDFDYKIIVADDCSTDRTIEILKKYKKSYPEKIELLLSDHNMGSLSNSNRIFDGLQCEYFSFLDGDDYWIGDERLQKQVDFLDSHPEYSLCGGNTQYLKNNALADYVVDGSKLGRTYDFESLLNEDIPFVHTSALLLRNNIFKFGLPECFKKAEDTFENCALRGEDFRRILHLETGPMYLMKETVSVYRIHENGLWQGSSYAKRTIESAITNNYYKKYFGNKYGLYFVKKAKESYKNMMNILIVDYNLLGVYRLNKNETFLLTSLMNDLALGKKSFKVNNSIKRKLLRIIIRILKYLI